MDTSHIPEIANAIGEKYKLMGLPVYVDTFNVCPVHTDKPKPSQFIICCFLNKQLNTIDVVCYERQSPDNSIWLFLETEHFMQVRCDRPLREKEAIEDYVRDNFMADRLEPRFL
jgi:hypothetical protein